MSEHTVFGELLRRHRIMAGLTREALAERARLSVEAIALLERGQRTRPRLATVAGLAAALALDPPDRTALLAAATAPEPDAGPATPAPLPKVETLLFGRERDLAAVGRLVWGVLPGPSGRIVTLTGPGGVGKTRLAIAVAGQGAAEDEVAFVDLSALRDTPAVPSTIARALGVQETDGENVWSALATHLRTRRLRLVLDNFEQVMQAASPLADLVAGCPPLTVLVTSRAPLRVRREHVYPLSPLALPGESQSSTALASSAAIQLIVARARETLPDFAPDEATLPALGDICRRLDGLPLAIELAAAHIATMSPQKLAAVLERRMPSLRGGRRLPARHQTLRATVAWSYDLLSPDEQRLFRHLAVFSGGCTLAAIQEVATPDDRHIPDHCAVELLDNLAVLVDQSLLRLDSGVQARGGEVDPRFRLLETVREFAQERLTSGGEAGAVLARHARYFLALAEETDQAWSPALGTQWLDRLEREHDNVRAALGWYLRHDVATGLRFGGHLGPFWRVHGHFAEGRRYLEALLEATGMRSEHASTAAAPRARALLEAGTLAIDQGDTARAAALLEESLALARSLGDPAAQAAVLQQQGWLALRRSDFTRARLTLEQSLALFRAIGDRRETGNVLRHLGGLAADIGAYQQARAYYAESRSLSEQLGDRQAVCWLLSQQGRLAQVQGDLVAAHAFLELGLTFAREIGDRRAIAWNLSSLGNLQRVSGNFARAQALLLEALPLFAALGDHTGQGSVIHHLGHLAVAQGELSEARQQYDACLATFRSCGADLLAGIVTGDLANLCLVAGDIDRARSLWQEVLTILRRHQENRWAAGWAMVNVATLVISCRRYAEGVRLLAAAEVAHPPFWASIDPDERTAGEAALATARAALGEPTFAAVRSAGQELPLAEALDAAQAALA